MILFFLPFEYLLSVQKRYASFEIVSMAVVFEMQKVAALDNTKIQYLVHAQEYINRHHSSMLLLHFVLALNKPIYFVLFRITKRA